MLAVNISKSITGKLDERDPTDVRGLAEKYWAMADETAAGYADTLLAIAHNTVAAVYTVRDWRREPAEDNKIVFDLAEAPEWEFLLGADSPVLWTRGQANPVRKIDVATASDLHARRPARHDGGAGWSLDVAPDGRSATIRAPHGPVALTGVDGNTAQLSILDT